MARGPKIPLRDEVRELLLSILRDTSASATARASAGRTLLESDLNEDDGGKAPGEMTAKEIDDELAGKAGKGR
jgi:hypothetical protein